jgi:cell division protein FtsL
MSGTTMVVVIVCVVFGIIYKMHKTHLEFKAKSLNQSETSDQQTDQLKEQVEKLTERVKVLEKIVTDEGYQVQKDINNL